MKAFFNRFIHSLPVQLIFLHFRRYQILLLFWLFLFAVLQGGFAKGVGADALLLDPEYLGKVNFYSTFFVGIAFGIFIVSWNITTFIINSKRIRFLATTKNPLGKYSLNNSVLPLALFLYFLYRLYAFQRYNELNEFKDIFFLELGFIMGFAVLLFITYTYFLSTDRKIALAIREQAGPLKEIIRKFGSMRGQSNEHTLEADYYLYTPFKVKRTRKVDHYDYKFLDQVLGKHHTMAVILIVVAFIVLIVLGYLTEYNIFRIPAAANAIIFISVLIAFSGAFVYLFKSWSLLVLIGLLFVLNFFTKNDIIHTTSKAYGLDYNDEESFPPYNPEYFQLTFSDERIEEDRKNALGILNNWKRKVQKDGSKPPIVFLNVSGGGSRSATWTMNVLQTADSLLEGELMQHTVLITGASGGMVAAAYYRELFLEKVQGKDIRLADRRYRENISKDLLNTVMASFVVNDFFTPFRNFTLDENIYPRDRAYAFERQLNINLENKMEGKILEDYKWPERQADIPLIVFTPTFTDGGRKLFISSQKMSFLSRINEIDSATQNLDGVDFQTFFEKQNPEQLFLTSAIRMNATFPYVLPDVSLPTRPVVDVMDAGVRDNYGKTTSLRFIEAFGDWINENTSGVIFIQVRDKQRLHKMDKDQRRDIFKLLFRPLLTIQYNWSSFQNYEQEEMAESVAEGLDVPFHRVSFQYIPGEEDKAAPLNWHLTEREKEDIASAIENEENQEAFKRLKLLINSSGALPEEPSEN